MKILNLVYPEKSDIGYRIYRFPDGQQQVVLNTNWDIDYDDVYFPRPIRINSRLNDFKDLELIICATKSLRNLGVKKIHLYTFCQLPTRQSNHSYFRKLS
jgi:hypothetical protein